jgi:Ca-activated chloride channel homolog
MRYQNPTNTLLLPVLIIFAAFLFYSNDPVSSQTPNKNSNGRIGRPSRKAIQLPPRPTPTPESDEVVKVDVDLVKVDALVLQKKTARIVGGLQKEDFFLYEDGTKQEITHFSQDKLPLSVMLVIDRGGCLDPYNDEVHRAAREAIDRLKLVDEIAVVAYHTNTELIQPFTTNRILLEDALTRIPPHNEVGGHCLNTLFDYAANYMMKAANPAGRRVIIVISGLTRAFDCPDSPSGRSAAMSIFESGTVVCAIIPKSPGQAFENASMTMFTRLSKVGRLDYMDIQNLANETGGEVLADEPKKLETTFQTLIDHLRSRYNLGFVSTNKNRDGATRKLRLDLGPSAQKSQGKLVIKARRSYIAPRN